MKPRILTFILLLTLPALVMPGLLHSQTVFFKEGFEDADFIGRAWYDNMNIVLTDTQHTAGSTKSAQFHFKKGSRLPDSGGGIRHLFPESQSVCLSYRVKYSSNWEGSNKPYHPHEFHFLTNVDSKWIGPASTHLTTYIEQNEGVPLLSFQDSQNIDSNNINVNLCDITEIRASAGCNGNCDGLGKGDCYKADGQFNNGKAFRADKQYFTDIPGKYYKGDWHFVEAFFRLNNIINGKAVADGLIRYRLDGELLIDARNVIMRTGRHPDMKFNQFIIAPYIGDGSPVDQTMWIDDLTVADSPLTDSIDAPILLSPPDKQTGIISLPEFVWSSVSRANSYHLQVAFDSLFNDLLINKPGLIDTVYKKIDSSGLSTIYNNTTFFWRVRAGSESVLGNWSEVFSYITKYSKPLISCIPNPFGDTAVISYSAHSGSLTTIDILNPNSPYFTE